MNYSHYFLSLFLNSMPAVQLSRILTALCLLVAVSSHADQLHVNDPLPLKLPATDPLPNLEVITDHGAPAPISSQHQAVLQPG